MLAGGQRTAFGEQREEVPAFDIFHGQIEQTVRLSAEVEDANRVGMVETRGGAGLPPKALRERFVAGEFAMQYFDGNGLLERQLLGEVHDAHGPFAELP